jgi:hypothetical protein
MVTNRLRRAGDGRSESCSWRPCASTRFRLSPAASWRRPDQLGQADQVVGRRCQGERPAHPFEAAQPGLGLPGDRLNPAERLLDLLTRPLASPRGGWSRPSMAERQPLVFCAMCGVTWRARNSMTKSLASNPRSAPTVAGPAVGSRSSMASAASRSACPESRVSSASTTRPCQFSISTWPTKQSRASMPGPLR